jgi:hypothetical protein
MPDEGLELQGFSLYRADRGAESGKKIGGGVCMYINSRWCSQVTVKAQTCTPNYELLQLQCRPFYLPCEFSCVALIGVYIHPKANFKQTNKELATLIVETQSSKPDCPIIIMGDFNGCRLSVPKFYQYMKVATRGEKTLDLVYSNVKDAFTSIQKPPVGRSDHNAIQLLPKYKQKLKTEPVVTRTVTCWDRKGVGRLQGCMACTEWQALIGDETDVNRITDIITCYIRFCEDMCLEEKQVKVYPNQKPWVTRDVKNALKKKHTDDGKKDLRKVIRKSKQAFSEKAQSKFEEGQSREVWKGVGAIVGTKKKNVTLAVEADPDVFVNNMNTFYARLDSHDDEIDDIKHELSNVQNDESLVVSEEEVKKVFSGLNPRKAQGPDGISPRLLRECAQELASIFQTIFNMTIAQEKIPLLWKTSKLVPAPKKKNMHRI